MSFLSLNSNWTANTGGVSSLAYDIARKISKPSINADISKIVDLLTTAETKPSQEAIDDAIFYLESVSDRAFKLGTWSSPHITVSELGEIVFEWWCGPKKITFYFGNSNPEYIQVWGTDIDTEMETGILSAGWTLTRLWLWLHQ